MITLSLTEDELLVLAVALATRSKHLDTWIGGRVSIDTDTSERMFSVARRWNDLDANWAKVVNLFDGGDAA